MTATHTSRSDDRDRVLDASDIVQIVGECVSLKPKGREFVSLCPFHDDHSPSMFVSPAKQIFKCFSCGVGGNAIDFVIRYHRIDFREALTMLAERAGIELSSQRNPSRNDDTQSDGSSVSGAELIDAHRRALSYYQGILRHTAHGRVARELYAGRGIAQAQIDQFELGAAADRWDGLVQTLQSKSIPLEPFMAAGLIQQRRTGPGFVDRFRNRLIFPIHDMTGRPIAFGARKIDPDDEPKYLNSAEHARFNKSRTLYGLHLARRELQRTSTAILVEGYTDVIACHQAGVRNAVATLGTSLTREHAAMLRRLCDRVVLVFDGDAAGQKAADRAVEIFFSSDVDVRIAVLPGGKDPAELVADPDGAAEFNRAIASASDALDFLFAALKRNLGAAGDAVSGRQRIVEQFGERLGQLGFHQMGPLRRDLALAQMSGMIGVGPEILLRAIPKPRKSRPMVAAEAPHDNQSPTGSQRRSATGATGNVHSARRDAERGLLGCLLYRPLFLTDCGADGRTVEETIRPEWFADGNLRRILDGLLEVAEDQRDISRLPILGEDDELSSLATDLYWRIRRESDDRIERARELLSAYVEAVRDLAESCIEISSEAPYGSTENNPRGGGSTLEEDPLARLASVVRVTRERGGNPRRLARAASSPSAPAPAPRKQSRPTISGNGSTAESESGDDADSESHAEGVPTGA